jgi:hypothetical protein
MAITTADAALAWVGYNGTAEDQVFVDAYNAAEGYVSERCSWPTVDDEGEPVDPPASLVEAVNLLTARYLARRTSPNGMVGMDDLGAFRVPGSDGDVERLMNPWRDIAVA